MFCDFGVCDGALGDGGYSVVCDVDDDTVVVGLFEGD